MKIISFGSMNIDKVYQVENFVLPGETILADGIQLNVGGKGLNQSVAAARAGACVVHAGAVGEDGAMLTDFMKDAGVDISYGGATTAAAEAQGLDEAGKTVSFDELQPGDLIFYSFTSNGRYKNISHVAVYVGNGKVVEALNESLGVVYRDVASTGKIVVIGRP